MMERQVQHGILLGLLLGAALLVCGINPDLLSGQLAGISSTSWLVLALVIPISHQLYVWIVWRAELHHGLVTRWLGFRLGFYLYALGFAFLFFARLVALVALAISNYGTLRINSLLAWGILLVLAAPWGYAIYSVVRYFGIRRALGIDHFDPAYRRLPFVKQGIFRFTRNGMYGPGFLAVWFPGLIGLSQAALLAACFSHLYIWVHYYVTELPDIHHIYGDR